MKIKIPNLILIVSVTLLVVFSCKKEKGYDWSNIDPGKQQITGPDSIKGNDSTVYEFLAIPRGGSTYTWEVLNGPVTIKVDTLNRDALHYHPYRAEVTASSTTNTTGAIVVRETTWAGKQGETDTFYIQKIFCYWPFNLSDFVGQYTCIEEIIDHLNNNHYNKLKPFDVNITHVGSDTFMVDNFFDLGWQLKFVLSEDKNETLTIVKTMFENLGYGNFDGNLDVKGSGTYSTCIGTFKLNFAMLDHALGDTVYSVTDYFKHK